MEMDTNSATNKAHLCKVKNSETYSISNIQGAFPATPYCLILTGDGKRARDGGGFLFAIGSHMVDSLLWWMDEEITEVYGDLRTQVPAYNGDAGLELRDAEDAFTFTGCLRVVLLSLRMYFSGDPRADGR